jgi:hypothetical protein
MNPASKLNVVINKAPAPSNWFLEDRYLGMFMHKRKGQDGQPATLPFKSANSQRHQGAGRKRLDHVLAAIGRDG